MTAPSSAPPAAPITVLLVLPPSAWPASAPTPPPMSAPVVVLCCWSVCVAQPGRRVVRAAQSLRMSKEHQTYSIDIQKDAIRSYADIMGYEIVATYEDAGRSGLKLGGRSGLQRLLADVESGRADFETIVVYDV